MLRPPRSPASSRREGASTIHHILRSGPSPIGTRHCTHLILSTVSFAVRISPELDEVSSAPVQMHQVLSGARKATVLCHSSQITHRFCHRTALKKRVLSPHTGTVISCRRQMRLRRDPGAQGTAILLHILWQQGAVSIRQRARRRVGAMRRTRQRLTCPSMRLRRARQYRWIR